LASKLRDLLNEIFNKPINEQKSTLEETFLTWKGKKEQVDDVLVMGIRV
jgi:hypothetical protein